VRVRIILDWLLGLFSHPSTGSCVLDWDRRDGFLKTSVVLASGRYWYIIGYTEELGGPVVRVCINPKKHIEDISEMPLRSAREFFSFYRKARGLLELAGQPRNVYVNLGGEDSGEIIKMHFHCNMGRAPSGKPSSGMGLNLIRVMYDRLDELVAAMLADLDALTGNDDATTDDYAARVAYWMEQRELFVAAKEKADAIKREPLR